MKIFINNVSASKVESDKVSLIIASGCNVYDGDFYVIDQGKTIFDLSVYETDKAKIFCFKRYDNDSDFNCCNLSNVSNALYEHATVTALHYFYKLSDAKAFIFSQLASDTLLSDEAY